MKKPNAPQPERVNDQGQPIAYQQTVRGRRLEKQVAQVAAPRKSRWKRWMPYLVPAAATGAGVGSSLMSIF